MLFNSLGYFAFLPAVWLLSRLVGDRLRKPLLLAASWGFYAAWDWRFLLLLIASTLIDFSLALKIASIPPGRAGRKRWMVGSICWGLSVLGFFKYYDFFAASFADLLSSAGIHSSPAVLGIILPVGISFYTFQTLAYVVDVYYGKVEPARNLLDFALYLGFFPQLVAGPIHRKQFLFPQIAQINKANPSQIISGLCLILLGCAQKILLSDNIAPYVELAFKPPHDAGGINLALGVLLFAAQIYLDFSGYTNIARGSAMLFGVTLMQNFHRPYFSRTVADFWKRWHISLSTWLRDYLYIPLGGSRGSEAKISRNLMLVMVIGGLWHGANWTFVVWGAYHGFLLVATRLLGIEERAARCGKAVKFLFVLATFALVAVGWVPFRCASLHDTAAFFGALAGPPGIFNPAVALACAGVWLGILVIDGLCARYGRDDFLRLLPVYVLVPVCLVISLGTFLTLLSNLGNERPFIYFQF